MYYIASMQALPSIIDTGITPESCLTTDWTQFILDDIDSYIGGDYALLQVGIDSDDGDYISCGSCSRNCDTYISGSTISPNNIQMLGKIQVTKDSISFTGKLS